MVITALILFYLPDQAAKVWVRVTEVSPEVKNLSVDQLVLLASGSTWAEEIVAPAAGFLPLPSLGPISADDN